MTRLAAFIFLFTVAAGNLCAETRPKQTLASFLNKKWTVLEFGLTQIHSDYTSYGPTILIQRLPDDRFLLSAQKRRNRDGGIPVPLRFVSEKEVTQWTITLVKILTAASLEESSIKQAKRVPEAKQQKIRKGYEFGSSFSAMKIRIGGSEFFTRHFGSIFDEEKATLFEYVTFARQLIEPPE